MVKLYRWTSRKVSKLVGKTEKTIETPIEKVDEVKREKWDNSERRLPRICYGPIGIVSPICELHCDTAATGWLAALLPNVY